MDRNESVTVDQLRSLLTYDETTGIFTRKVSRGNSRKGSEVGYKTEYGYVRIKINRVYYMAHRLAWLYVYGKWPKIDIDHRDGIRHHNWIENLREGTRSQNIQNLRGARKDSKSGVLGVDQVGVQWRAQIQLDGRKEIIGYYLTVEEAEEAYLKRKREIHEFCLI